MCNVDSKHTKYTLLIFFPFLVLYAAYLSVFESGSTHLVDQWDILRSSSYCFLLWHLPLPSVGCISDHTGYDLCPLAVRHFWVCPELFRYFLPSNHQESISLAIGYHRLYSHRAFRASFGVRAVLAVLGTLASEGSIKVCGHNLYSIPYAYARLPTVVVSFSSNCVLSPIMWTSSGASDIAYIMYVPSVV